MKKYIALFLAIFMVILAFSSCGGSDGNTPTPAATTTSSSTTAQSTTALGGTKFSASYFDDADHNTCAGYAFAQDGNLFTWLLEQTKAD